MRMNKLGRTDMEVTDICLGTMTFGQQTSKADSFRQLDMAHEHGINFLDTAEAYPVVPMKRETAGDTERYIGEWFKQSGNRGAWIVATKVAGEGNHTARDGSPITGAVLRQSAEASLGKLQTDVIDLYQLHWPNRGSYHFRKYWHYDPSGQARGRTEEEIVEILSEAQKLIDEGKIRAIALSNESAWGTMQFLSAAEKHGLPRVATMQNEYSLLCRIYDTDMAEVSHHEDVGLLAFSPLAAGLLSGKYQDDATPKGSRREVQHDLSGRLNKRAIAAVGAYLEIAKTHELDPVQMAVAFCNSRHFMASTIIGATTPEQLERILAGKDLVLSDAVLHDIGQANREHPMPI